MTRKNRKAIRTAAVTLLLLFVAAACSDDDHSPTTPQTTETPMSLSKDHAGIRHAMDVQTRNTDRLFEHRGVTGTGTGMTEDGEPAIILFTEKEIPKGQLPEMIEGLPVLQRVSGSLQLSGKPCADKKTTTGTTGTNTGRGDRLPRPVPIGVSTSNSYDCGAGTIGVRVKDAEGYYILSCNHIFARLNAANSGELILQPGRADLSCSTVLTDEIARVSDLEPIVYSPYHPNVMDAAIAGTTPAMVGNSTPGDGYGIPGSTPVTAQLGMEVQKYGRSTGLTKGKVYAINCIVLVPYPAGATRFVDQIVIEPIRKNKTFVDVGDSGSLVVTDDANASPIGLAFAKSGDLTYVTPIAPILQRFNVQIDGK